MNYATALSLAGLLAADSSPARAKVAVVQAAQAVPQTYAVKVKPSDMVLDHAAMRALAAAVEKDARADLAACAPGDKAALIGMHSTLYYTALVREDFTRAQGHLEKVRELQTDPILKQMAGLVVGPLLEAKALGGDLRTAYRARLAARLVALPLEGTTFALKATLQAQQSASRERIIAQAASVLDPQVKEGRLGLSAVGTLLTLAANLELVLPLKEDVVACLQQAVAARPEAVRPILLGTKVNAKGPFFGQPRPGETPVPFAPEVLAAISPWVGAVAFSPDGLECFLNIGDADYAGSSIYHTTCRDGAWTPLVEAAFTKDIAFAGEPVFSRDGRTLTFTGKQGKGGTDFWVVRRTSQGWGEAERLPAPINSESDEFRYCEATDGTVYFASGRAGAMAQIHRATQRGNDWEVEKLGAPINKLANDGDPCIAPDGRFLVFYSARPGGQGRVDLHVSFSDGKGGWTEPRNLGAAFNSPGDDFGASLTSDGKSMFFLQYGAKRCTLYWVTTSAIDRLAPKGINP